MSKEGQQLRKKIEAFSPYLTHIMGRHPSLAKKVLDQGEYLERKSADRLAGGLKKKLAGIKNFQTFCLALRHFKQEEIFHIAVRDLEGLADLKETTESLSSLARVCLQSAITFCLHDQPGFKNSPVQSDLEQSLVVLALGKLGGRELNFSSDIDLIFFYRSSPAGLVAPLEQKETLQVVTRRVIQAMGAPLEGDHVFRVDLGLRPGGKDSDLVISLDSALEFYQTSARTWERMALIKARPLGGNMDLGKSFLKELRPLIYRKFVDYTVLAEIRSMKQKILTETTSHLLKGDDIKLGPGGIREIEFIVQALQMIFGGKVPSIQEPNTLKALAKLRRAQLIPKEECRLLSQSYTFLRTLEHRIQMVHQRQTQTLPHQPGALEGISRVMPLKRSKEKDSVKGLISELDRMRTKVRIAFENLLLANSPISQDRLAGFFRSPGDPEILEKGLKAAGFQEWQRARDILETWNRKSALSPVRQKFFLDKLFPLLLGYCLQTVNPDQSLSFIDRFLQSVGGRNPDPGHASGDEVPWPKRSSTSLPKVP